MTLPFWCVFVVGILPYSATMIAKWNKKDYDNANPREWIAKQEGVRARANAAQLNSFEAFPLFAAAVVIAHLRQAALEIVSALCIAFVTARIVYMALYIADVPSLRSIVWLVGLGCSIALFFVA